MFVHTDPLYSINKTCGLLSRGRAFIYEAINEGELESIQVGGRRFITAEAIDSYIALISSPEYQAAQRAKRKNNNFRQSRNSTTEAKTSQSRRMQKQNTSESSFATQGKNLDMTEPPETSHPPSES